MVQVTYTSTFVDPRKGKGWAAILTPTAAQEVERRFIDTQKTWGKRGYIFHFSIDLPEGTILEIAQGGSWKNTYRGYYQVAADGKLQYVGDSDSIAAKEAVAKILGVPTLRFASWKKDGGD